MSSSSSNAISRKPERYQPPVYRFEQICTKVMKVTLAVAIIAALAIAAVTLAHSCDKALFLTGYNFLLPTGMVGGLALITAVTCKIILDKKDRFVLKEGLPQPLRNRFKNLRTLHPQPQPPANPVELEPNPPLTSLDDHLIPEAAFSLLNDFMGFKAEELPVNPQISLSVLIRYLEELHESDMIEDRASFTSLLADLKQAHTWISWIYDLEYCETQDAYHAARAAIKTSILEVLQERGRVYVPSGYTAMPAGHHVLLELTYANGWVSGKILNTGEGLEYHGDTIGQEIFGDVLHLKPTPISELTKSHFLEAVIDLRMGGLLPSEITTPHTSETNYSIKDLYHGVFPQWPGGIRIPRREQDKQASERQRTDSCSMSPFLRLIEKHLGRDGRIANLHVAMRVVMHLLVRPRPTHDFQRIKEAIEKINRDAHAIPNLPDRVRFRTLQFTTRATILLNDLVEKQRDRINAHQLNFTEMWTEESIPLVNLTAPFGPRPSRVADEPEMGIPQITRENFVADIEAAYIYLRSLERRNRLEPARWAARDILTQLPLPDDSFWHAIALSNLTIEHLTGILETLFKGISRRSGPLHTTPNEALLYLKLELIVIQQCENELPDYLLNDFKTNLRTIYEANQHGRFLTHPTYTQLCQSCRNILKQFPTTTNLISIMEEIPRGHNQRQDYPEWKFLETFLERHPELLEQRSIEEGIGALYFDEASRDLYSEAEGESSPCISSIVRWKCLRRISTLFNFSNWWCGGSVKGQVAGRERGVHIRYLDPEKKRCFTADNFQMDPKLSLLIPEGAHRFLNIFGELPRDQQDELPISLFNKGKYHQNHLLRGCQQGFGDFLTPLEFQKLQSIHIEQRWQLPQLISFFEHRFYRFKEPSFRALFQLFFFAPRVNRDRPGDVCLAIEEVCKCPSKTKELLFNFLHSALETSKQLNWINTQAMLIRVTGPALRFFAEAEPDSLLLTRVILQFTDFLDLALNTEEGQSEIFHSILALAPYCDHPALKTLLERTAQAKIPIARGVPPPDLSKQLQWNEDVKRAEEILRDYDAQSNLLPKWIVDNDTYKLHFKRNHVARQIEPEIYEFADENGILHKISKLCEGFSYIEIYRQIAGRWFKWDRREHANWQIDEQHPGCEEGYLSQDAFYWYGVRGPRNQSLPNEARVFSQATGKTKCIIRDGTVCHPTRSNLTLVENYDHPIINSISRLDGKENTLVWKDRENHVCCIEIPQYSLTFSRDRRDRWLSEEYPGFFLDASDQSAAIEPCSRYLILCNQDGKRIALIPRLELTFGPQEGPFIPRVQYGDEKTTTLFTYSLNEAGELVLPHDQERLLYLCYVALNTFDYEGAKRTVDVLRRERPELTEESCKLIENLSHKDIHPHATALRLHLTLLASECSAIENSETAIKQLLACYMEYLDAFHDTSGMRLTQDEERAVLSKLEKLELPEVEAYRLAIRRYHLGDRSNLPARQVVGKPLPTTLNFRFRERLDDLTPELEQIMWQHLEKPLPVAYLARPGPEFIANFLYYYSIARHLKKSHPLHKELRSLLQFSAQGSDPKVVAFHKILSDVLCDPLQFPSIEYLRSSNFSLKQELEKNCRKSGGDFTHWSYREMTNRTHTPQLLVAPRARVAVSEPASGIEAPSTLTPCPNRSFKSELIRKGFLVPQDWAITEQNLLHQKETLDNLLESFSTLLQQEQNPCTQKVYEERLEGLRKKIVQVDEKIRVKSTPYRLNPDQMENLRDDIQIAHRTFCTDLVRREEALLNLATTYPPAMRLEANGRLLQPLKLHELLTYVATNDDRAIAKSNPSLTEEQIRDLKAQVVEYAIQKTHLQHILRVAAAIEDGDIPLALKQLQSERVYNPVDRVDYLIFELFENIRIRTEQDVALQTFCAEGANVEYQARTGFGKSSVLSPLLLYLKSRREGLSMMTVPRALFQSQYRHLQKVMGKAFDTVVIPIEFDRNRANDYGYLKKINAKFAQAERENKIILTTTHALHGMTSLKLKESLTSEGGETEKSLQEELFALRRTIMRKVFALADESKVSFALSHRYDYATGALAPLNPEQIETAADLYRFFLTQTDLLDHFNFEFYPQTFSADKPTLHKEDYESVLLPFLERTLTEHNKELTPLMAKHLFVHLKRTLFRKCGDDYNFLEGSRIAKPHRDGVARKQNEYSDLEDLLDFTIQANLKRPFASKDVETFFDKLKLKAIEHGSDSPKLKAFLRHICQGQNLIELTDVDYQRICDDLNEQANLALRLDFIEVAILPEIRIYMQKVTSTPFNLMRALKQINAMSATTMGEILPRLSLVPDHLADIDNLIAIQERHSFTEMQNPDPQRRLAELLATHRESNVLIDIACTFRDLKPLQIAEQILETRADMPGVMVWDEEGKALVLLRGQHELIARNACFMSNEELFIYLRKSKAVGTNLVLPTDTHAIATLDRDIAWNQLIQGVGRMRKLPEGQTIHFAYGQEDRKLIFKESAPSLQRLFGYTIEQQGLENGNSAFYALRLFGEDLIYASIWRDVERHETPEAQRAAFKPFAQFFIKDTQATPTTVQSQYRQKYPMDQARERLKQEIFAPVTAFCAAYPERAHLFAINAMKERFDAFASTLKLPREVALSAQQAGECVVDVTADETTDSTLTSDNINQQENESDLPKVNYQPAKPLGWDGNFTHLLERQAPARRLLGVDIYESPNFPRVSRDPTENAQVQKHAYQTLLIVNRGKHSLLLLDLHDAARAFEYLQNLDPSVKLDSEAHLFSGPHPVLDHPERPAPTTPALTLLRKLYTAYPTLTHAEKEFLVSSPERAAFLKYTKSLQGIWPHLSKFLESCLTA